MAVVNRLVRDETIVAPDGSPSGRHQQPRDHRGSDSPGYFFPVRSATNRPPRIAASTAEAAYCQLPFPAAQSCRVPLVAFHVVNRNERRLPSIVSLTSPDASAASTRWPTASISRHCSSVNGFVTRGDSWIRRTCISCSSTDSHLSTLPAIGAALNGSVWPPVGDAPHRPATQTLDRGRPIPLRADTPLPRHAGR